MSFTDMIKKSVLEGFAAGDLTAASIALTLGIAVVLGLYIYFVYRLSARGGFYNRNFNRSLATMPVITAAILLAMQSNLVISLGMVGALSIVRFRNAVKDAGDLTYLFWSISVGIVAGAGLYVLAVILSLCVTVLVLVLDLIPTLRAPCMLVISGESAEAEAAMLACVKKQAGRVRVRSRNVSRTGAEWIIELQVKEEGALMAELTVLPGIRSANLLSHDGELRL